MGGQEGQLPLHAPWPAKFFFPPPNNIQYSFFFSHGKILLPLLAKPKIAYEEGYSYFCSAPFYFLSRFAIPITSTQAGCSKCEQSLSWYKPEESQLQGNVDVCRTLKLFSWPMSIDVNTPAVNWGVLIQHILETARRSHAASLFSRALSLQVHFAGQALFAYAFHAFQTQFQSIQGHSGGPSLLVDHIFSLIQRRC